MPADTLHLPRTLVNQLLRQAQLAVMFSQGWVLRDPNGYFRPVTLAPDTGILEAAAGTLPNPPFAFYRSSKLSQNALTSGEIAALSRCTSLYLDIALDTKGVLQLHAWRIVGTRATETAVTIKETTTDLQ